MGTCCNESADNKRMIAAATNEDHTWKTRSGKKMEGEEGLNTVECLRGRLLAERQASRVAREEAESMGNKLVELEKKLREEIKLREKAERKLKFLKKKLESFNMSSSMSGSDSSEKCETSCGSSLISSDSRHYSQAKETKHHATNPALSENAVHNHNVSDSDPSELIHTPNSPSTTKDCESRITDNSSCDSDPGYFFPQILCKDPNPCYGDLKNDERRSNPNPGHASPENICQNPNPNYDDLRNDESRLSSLSSKSSMTENEDDHEAFFDNSLALVPVNVTATSQVTSNPKPVNKSVLEALDALRHARERLLGSMGTRQMIQVGPT